MRMIRDRSRIMLLLPLAAGVALRLLPLQRYPGFELQELYPNNAVVAIARGDWEPVALHHGGGLLTVLRALFTLWYAAGRLTGRYADRIDLLAAYARDPFPFVLTGRLIVVACALGSLYLVARLGQRLAGAAAGVAGAWLLAVTFMHVRVSHQVWLDVPAGAAALLAVAAALRARARPEVSAAALAGAAGGMALASKLSMFPIALPIALGAWWGAAGRPPRAARRLAAAAAAAVAVFALLSPYTILKFRDTVQLLMRLHGILFGDPGQTLTLGVCLRYGIGVGIFLLALVGLAGAVWAAPAEATVVAAFPAGYVVVLAGETVLYSRYLAVLAPFTALFAGVGAALLGRRLGRRHAALVTAILVALAGAAPARQSVGYVRLLARRDTRQLAGEWIQSHVPLGTPLAVPNAVPYPNPSLHLDPTQVAFRYPAFAKELQARGVGDPRTSYPLQYLGFFAAHPPDWEPRVPIVVFAHHPVVWPSMNEPPEYTARLEAAGARPVARFDSVREPLPPGVVYEPIDADYMPLDGFGAVDRPGPNVTIWALPGAPLAMVPDGR